MTLEKLQFNSKPEQILKNGSDQTCDSQLIGLAFEIAGNVRVPCCVPVCHNFSSDGSCRLIELAKAYTMCNNPVFVTPLSNKLNSIAVGVSALKLSSLTNPNIPLPDPLSSLDGLQMQQS